MPLLYIIANQDYKGYQGLRDFVESTFARNLLGIFHRTNLLLLYAQYPDCRNFISIVGRSIEFNFKHPTDLQKGYWNSLGNDWKTWLTVIRQLSPLVAPEAEPGEDQGLLKSWRP